MLEKTAPCLNCPCGYEGSDFTEMNLVLNDSAVTIEDEAGIVTEKVLSLFVCPVCGTVKLPLPSLASAHNDDASSDELCSGSLIEKKTVYLFFMIDASGSMEGSKIGAVNSAFEELMFGLKDTLNDHPGWQIKIAALQFSSGARWITGDGPVSVEQLR
jgi:hypothetical protein